MRNFKDKNILVTGGAGFIGSHLVEELVKKQVKVVVPYKSLSSKSYFNYKKLGLKTILIKIDLKNYKRVLKLVRKYKIDFIFHLAAQPLVETAFKKPLETLENNILGTVNILEAARIYKKIKRVVVASSDKAYGKLNNKGKYSESDPLKGDHPYEVSKSAADLISQTYFKTYELPIVVTRFGNVFGPGDIYFSRLVPGIMKAICQNKIFKIRSNGKFIRDYIYVKDVVDGYLAILKNFEKIKGETFNFGAKKSYSVLQLIKAIENTLVIKVKYKILNKEKNEIPYQSLNWQKARKILNWQPKTNFNQGIKKTFNWYKNWYFKR